MLTSFGLFWVGEGAGVHWPGSDLAILGFVGIFVLVPTWPRTAWMRSLLMPRVPRRCPRRDRAAPLPAGLRAFWWDFLIGDSPDFSWPRA